MSVAKRPRKVKFEGAPTWSSSHKWGLMLRAAGEEFTRRMASYLPRFARDSMQGKPLAVITRSWAADPEVTSELARFEKELLESGIPTYPTQERAARALAKFARYYQFLRETE